MQSGYSRFFDIHVSEDGTVALVAGLVVALVGIASAAIIILKKKNSFKKEEQDSDQDDEQN